jgi:NAD(P)-dependent dehydrogenase (short-subunit alcohol dehydrogenase family)
MTDRLAGKVCLITGTGGTMGRATALAFAREGALVIGCDVAIESAEETIELVRDAGGEMVSLQPCVLSDPAECERLVQFATDRFGRIDVLFNLAGRAYFDRLEDVTDADWDSARRDEVDLVFYLTRAAWPWLKASHGVVLQGHRGAVGGRRVDRRDARPDASRPVRPTGGGGERRAVPRVRRELIRDRRRSRRRRGHARLVTGGAR